MTVFDLFSILSRPFIAEKRPLPRSPASCQGWGRGFESHRPLHFPQKEQLLARLPKQPMASAFAQGSS
jgi:hypothetical protein